MKVVRYTRTETLWVMTARVTQQERNDERRLVGVTFILIDDKLITLRYGDPTLFRAFVVRAEKRAD